MLTLTPDTLPAAVDRLAYGAFFGSTGGVEPVTFKVTKGLLPNGFSLGPEGFMHGTPDKTGPYTFTVSCKDAHGAEVDRVFTLDVEKAPAPGDTAPKPPAAPPATPAPVAQAAAAAAPAKAADK
jgi:Putative Ig domain